MFDIKLCGFLKNYIDNHATSNNFENVNVEGFP